MLVEGKIHECAPCKRVNTQARSKQRTGVLVGIFLAILPKCPFCVVAYSSTMVLCSGKTVAFNPIHASSLTLAITAITGLVILSCILLNFHDKRTFYAFALALTGMAMVLYSVAILWTPWLYYSGVMIVFLGIWLNASLLNFLNKASSFFYKISRS